jgi:hypothetical protein
LYDLKQLVFDSTAWLRTTGLMGGELGVPDPNKPTSAYGTDRPVLPLEDRRPAARQPEARPSKVERIITTSRLLPPFDLDPKVDE